jgi:peptidoglycan/LPS O-acetylase OafA/YrhL
MTSPTWHFGTNRTGRLIPTIDGLRAFAILAVILLHSTTRNPLDGPFSRALERATAPGWAGVDLFFVVSGFLITGILLNTKTRPHFFRNFYLRRILRIFPAYYFTLVVVLWVMPLFLPTSSSEIREILHRQGWLWAYASNLSVLIHPKSGWAWSWLSLDHAWSLAVEEQFYVLWPFLVYFAETGTLKRIAAGIVVLSPPLRIAMLHFGATPAAVYCFTFCRFDGLAMGSLLAVYVRSGPSLTETRRLIPKLLFGGGLLLSAVFLKEPQASAFGPWVEIVGLSALGVLCSGIVLAAVVAEKGSKVERLLTLPALAFIGRYSYGMYLFHGVLEPFLKKGFPFDGIARVTHSAAFAHLLLQACAVAAATVAAYVSWHVIERPFIAMKERFTV